MLESRPRLIGVVATVWLLAVSACSGSDPTPLEESAAEISEELSTALDETTNPLGAAEAETVSNQAAVAPLTGLPDDNPRRLLRPAVVAQIDNNPEARPQAGIGQADIVIEVLIESFTRLIAVFHSDGADQLGPVRSARTSDIDILANFNRPLFGYSGANQTVATQLADAVTRGLFFDVGVNHASIEYYRTTTNSLPHNLFTTTEGLWSQSPIAAEAPKPLFEYGPEGEANPFTDRTVAGVSVSWRRLVQVDYIWDPGVGGWRRWQEETPHIDHAGAQVAPANVVILFTRYGTSAADAESPQALTRGSGRALVYSAGRVTDAVWTRGDGANDRWELADDDGNPVLLVPGQTWIELVEPGDAAELSAEAAAAVIG